MQKVQNAPENLTVAEHEALAHFSHLYSTAEMYYAYQMIHQIVTLPFQTHPAHVVFNAALFLAMRLANVPPPEGLLFGSVLFVLAQEAERRKAWKVARFAYLKLQSLRVCSCSVVLLQLLAGDATAINAVDQCSLFSMPPCITNIEDSANAFVLCVHERCVNDTAA
jgi:hypothetical protein